MKAQIQTWCGLILLCATLAISNSARAQSPDAAWNVAVLDKILASVPAGQNLAQIDDMQYPVAVLQAWRDQLATGATPNFAVGTNVNLWTGANVYYTFSNGISGAKQKAFTDAIAEWTLAANIHFIPWTGQPNYIMVFEDPTISGGLSSVGMIGGQQLIHLSPNAWNRRTMTHEMGHALGLVHEHQRSDRDNFITILTANIQSGLEGNFVLLPTSQNHGAYDFLSIMHYAHNAFSSDPNTLDTMQPLPAYSQFYNVMGNADPVLSISDRTNIAAIYGAAAALTNVVTNTQDNGAGSLRAAIYYGFDHPGTTITFNIPTNDPNFSAGVFTIQPSDAMPSLINATTINGSSEPFQLNPGGPAIQLSGALAAQLHPAANGIHFAGTNNAARGLIINGFPFNGVSMDNTNAVGNTVSGCFIGTDATGNSVVTNFVYPVLIDGGATRNIIGGTNAAARNVISGGPFQGILISDAGTAGNIVEGNYIGLNAAGTAALPNNFEGIAIYNGPTSNIIGGTTPGARNIVSGGASQGITLSGTGTSGNVIEGNYIGLNPAGTAAIANTGAGVFITGGATGNTVGGSVSGAGNLISGNVHQGVILNANSNVVAGNIVGLNAAGTAMLPNPVGVNLYGGAQGNIVGGTTPGTRNVISGNSTAQVQLQDAGTDFNVIEGNYIGTTPSGLSAPANTANGVVIFGTASSNVIGGTVAGARNVISGNFSLGMNIQGVGTTGNIVQGNTIGLDALNSNALPNTSAGIDVFGGATGTQIGGFALGAANLIASNTSSGVLIQGSTTSNNPIRGNSIYSNSVNGQSGIKVATGGNNGLTSPPVLSSAVVGASNTTVIGSLTSFPASTTFHIDFYASPGTTSTAQARDYVGTKDVTTSGAGSASFTNLLALIPIGQIITSTATDPAGNTSSESVFNGTAVSGVSTAGDGIPDAWRTAHFGGTSTNSTNCATCDADHDGENTLAEYLAGTNPTNATSVLQAGTVAKSGADMTLTFQSVPGVVYRVYQRDDVALGNWAIMADQVLGTGGNIQLTDPGAASLARRFYKLQVLP